MFFGITLVLFVLGLCFLMTYWGVNQIYKYTKNSINKNDTEIMKELYSLKQRVESLEKKQDDNRSNKY